MSAWPSKSLMRNLGRFVGQVVRAVRTPVEREGESQALRREVEQSVHDTTRGRVTLRRTVVEEMSIEPMEGRQSP